MRMGPDILDFDGIQIMRSLYQERADNNECDACRIIGVLDAAERLTLENEKLTRQVVNLKAYIEGHNRELDIESIVKGTR